MKKFFNIVITLVIIAFGFLIYYLLYYQVVYGTQKYAYVSGIYPPLDMYGLELVSPLNNYLLLRGIHPPTTDPAARTYYYGYVQIDPISLTDLKSRLQTNGCTEINMHLRPGPCIYKDKEETVQGEKGIIVLPHGIMFGPSSITITQGKIWATKDIEGLPSVTKYSDRVREDLTAIGNPVTVQENSWHIIRMVYPYSVIY